MGENRGGRGKGILKAEFQASVSLWGKLHREIVWQTTKGTEMKAQPRIYIANDICPGGTMRARSEIRKVFFCMSLWVGFQSCFQGWRQGLGICAGGERAGASRGTPGPPPWAAVGCSCKGDPGPPPCLPVLRAPRGGVSFPVLSAALVQLGPDSAQGLPVLPASRHQ